jgi:hypothetical protein
MEYNTINYDYFKQHFLYFLPLPHGHGSFLPIFSSVLGGFKSSVGFSSSGSVCFRGFSVK